MHIFCTVCVSVPWSKMSQDGPLKQPMISLTKASQEGPALKFPLNCISLQTVSPFYLLTHLDQVPETQKLLRLSCKAAKRWDIRPFCSMQQLHEQRSQGESQPYSHMSFKGLCKCINTSPQSQHTQQHILRAPWSTSLATGVYSWVTIYLLVVLLRTWNYSLSSPGFLLNLLKEKKKSS